MNYLKRAKTDSPLPAFLIAGVVTAATAAAIFEASILIQSRGSLADPIGMFALTFLMAIIICFMGGAALGLPITWFLHVINRESLPAYTSAGLIAGSTLGLPIFIGRFTSLGVYDALTLISFGGIPGSVGGAIWWSLARRKAVRGAGQ